jgi:glycine cleavage system transcriptional repressor
MARFLVTAEARDRTGIVASVSSSVAEKEWSIEDASMTRLAGHFVMLLVLAVPDDVTLDSVESTLNAEAADGLRFAVAPVESDATSTRPPGELWSVTVYGSDRPGIVAAITTTLANAGANILDLSTHVHGGDNTTYTMLMDVTIPEGSDARQLTNELSSVAEQLGVTCHAMPVDADIL